MAEMRPEVSERWLTAQDLAENRMRPLRAIQRQMRHWLDEAASGLYPRVEMRSRRVGGVQLMVEAESYERWVRGTQIAACISLCEVPRGNSSRQGVDHRDKRHSAEQGAQSRRGGNTPRVVDRVPLTRAAGRDARGTVLRGRAVR